jgi:hypothetical protein
LASERISRPSISASIDEGESMRVGTTTSVRQSFGMPLMNSMRGKSRGGTSATTRPLTTENAISLAGSSANASSPRRSGV